MNFSTLGKFSKEDTVPSGNPLERTNAKINEERQFNEECKSLLATESIDSKNIVEIKNEPEFDSEEDVSSQTGPKGAIEYEAVSAIKYEVDLKTESVVDPEENILQNSYQESKLISDVVKSEQDLQAYTVNLTNNEHQKLFKQNVALKELLLLRKKQVLKTKTQIKLYKQKNKSLSIVCDKLQSKMQERFLTLRKIFSLPQIHTLFQMKQSILWTEKDWIDSAALKNINEECYSYIKHTLHYPLPDSTNTAKIIPNVIVDETSLPNIPTSYK